MAARPPTRSPHLGLVAAVLSALCFGTAGPFAKALLESGWSAGAVVLLRVAGASLVLLPAALWSLRGRWHLLRDHAPVVVAYGSVAVAGCQLGYFSAVRTLSVGVALLIEYLAVVLVVVFVAVRTRSLPAVLTRLGTVLSIAGLVLVLDLAGQSRPDLVGVLWALLAAACLATYFILAAGDIALPPVALAGLGMGVGALVLLVLGLLRVLPMTMSSAPIHVAGADLSWWAGIGELALVAAAAAYLLGIVAARRLGSTVASFVGLTEVLFAVLFAWVLLGELPRPVQLAGGVLVLVGVVAVRLGEQRLGERAATGRQADEPDPVGSPDFVPPQPIA